MISVVIPVFNEQGSLAQLHGELTAVFATEALGPAEWVFVDDGSRDRSWDELVALAAQDSRVRAIRFRRNFGKAAVLYGGISGGAGRTSLHDGCRPAGRSRRDSPVPGPARRGLSTWSAAGRRPGMTPGTRSIPAGCSTGWSAG